ncbi:CHC2 zinc finger domain-containing protein, partial [Porphyromonas loveana]
MIDDLTRERILDAAKIEEVVSDYVSLLKRGVNYLGLCPF